MIAWMNENSGFLMVTITFIYVVATALICVFNWKSAKASRDQIISSQKQQEQNAGLQLYSMRKEIINKIAKHQYNEVFWDVPLLFDTKLSDEFAKIAYDAGRLEKLDLSIHVFEEELRMLFPQKKEVINSQIVLAKTNKDYDALGGYTKSILKDTTNYEKVSNSIDDYIKNLEDADNIRGLVDGNTFLLIQKLRDFIRNSIK